jgi:flagellar biosynthesis/type III secretory pathway protein FliH
MRLTSRQVRQGEMMPRFYGLAYYEFHRDEQVAYLIPFNLIVRWARDLAWLVKRGKKSALSESYERGYREGSQAQYDRGFDAGVRHGKNKAEFKDDFTLLMTGGSDR